MTVQQNEQVVIAPDVTSDAVVRLVTELLGPVDPRQIAEVNIDGHTVEVVLYAHDNQGRKYLGPDGKSPAMHRVVRRIVRTP